MRLLSRLSIGRKSFLSLALGLIASATVATTSGVADAKVKSNTQVRLPDNAYLGDIDGDGSSDFVMASGGAVYVARTDYEAHGILYNKLSSTATISRLVIGDFQTPGGGRESGKDQICAIMSDNSFACFAISDDKTQMWWWFTQGNFIGANEEAIVGDFDGNGSSDILAYNPSAGTVRMYTRDASGFFNLMPGFAPGNLTGNLVNKQLRVGEFGQTVGRDDLIAYDPTYGQVMRFDSVTDGNGAKTFWWAFTTNGGVVTSSEDIAVANIDGGTNDALVARNRSTGVNRFLALQYGNGNLVPITNVGVGQLPTNAGSQMFWTRNRGTLDSTSKRDDQMLYVPSTKQWINTHGRMSGSTMTYWWNYTQAELNLEADQDGDGIKTKHELGGYDANNDGVSDEPLQSYGASPFVKDVFLEIDYMAHAPGETADLSLRPAATNLATAEMAKLGINLHALKGNQVPFQAVLGGAADFDWVRDFDPIRTANFTVSRRPFFHYVLSAEAYRYEMGKTGSSGISRGIPATDLVVSLGSWGGNGTDQQQAGTLLHELGHNLGLGHGGVDGDNFKPNYVSIMSYNYQMDGIMKNGSRQWLYSEITTNDLNETSLDESKGVYQTAGAGSNTFQLLFNSSWFNVGSSTTKFPIDWNASGRIAAGVSLDINSDTFKTTLKGGRNDYAFLTYKFSGGAVGSASGESADLGNQAPAPRELNEADYVSRIKPHFDKVPQRDMRAYNVPVKTQQPLLLNF